MTGGEKLAWLAGLFDGEGTVTSSLNKKLHSFQLHIAIAMTHEETLWRVEDIFLKMGLKPEPILMTRRATDKHAACYCIRLRKAADLQLFAAHILSFSVTKQRQLKLLIAWASVRMTGSILNTDRSMKGRGPAGRVIPFESELQFHQELRALNERGPKSIPKRPD